MLCPTRVSLGMSGTGSITLVVVGVHLVSLGGREPCTTPITRGLSLGSSSVRARLGGSEVGRGGRIMVWESRILRLVETDPMISRRCTAQVQGRRQALLRRELW